MSLARPEDRVVRTWRPLEDLAALRAQFREPQAGVQGQPLCHVCGGTETLFEFGGPFTCGACPVAKPCFQIP